jgi:RNA polymerase sigma-70 factor (ECF subfamily)
MMTSAATAELQIDANDTDVELMLQAKAGDDAAFSELFQRYSNRLVSFAYRIVRNRWRAEELVQDAFLQIYRARDRYSPCARFSTYIYRVVTNNCLNEIRRQDHEKTVPGETRPLADDMTPGPDCVVMDRQIVTRIADMVRELPFKQRAALLLSRVEGFDHREVASCLGVSEFAVKSLVFRATRTLREGIEEHREPASKPRARRKARGSAESSHMPLAFGRAARAWLATGPSKGLNAQVHSAAS